VRAVGLAVGSGFVAELAVLVAVAETAVAVTIAWLVTHSCGRSIWQRQRACAHAAAVAVVVVALTYASLPQQPLATRGIELGMRRRGTCWAMRKSCDKNDVEKYCESDARRSRYVPDVC